MNLGKIRCGINTYGCARVSFSCWDYSVCWCKSRGVADKLVYSSDLAGDSNGFDLLKVALSISSPRSLVGFVVAESGAYWRGDL